MTPTPRPRPAHRLLSAILLATLALPALAAAPGEAEAPAAAMPPVPPPEEPAEGMLGTTDGQAIYQQVCQGCHMADGGGAQGGGSYPSFVDNPRLASPAYLATTILAGRRNMPAFDRELAPAPFYPPTWLTDEQVASVINHLRTHFGNAYPDTVRADDVRALRPRQGD